MAAGTLHQKMNEEIENVRLAAESVQSIAGQAFALDTAQIASIRKSAKAIEYALNRYEALNEAVPKR